jgi:hypothetical protein
MFHCCFTSTRNRNLRSYLFGSLPILHDTVVIAETDRNANLYGRISNEVPGFRDHFRSDDVVCTDTCNADKAVADVSFYRHLRNQFRLQTAVRTFRSLHFSGSTVIGLHVRAGNGETGQFSDIGRGIPNVTVWTSNLADQVMGAVRKGTWGNGKFIIFLATDTPTLIDVLRALVQERNPDSKTDISIVHMEQIRPPEGTGVLFGEFGKVLDQGAECLKAWEDTFMDMMLLSHADVLIAARPSSYTMSLPLSLVLSTDKSTRIVAQPYCEVSLDALNMRCYSDFMDWCCPGRLEFNFGPRSTTMQMPAMEMGQLNISDSQTQELFHIKQRPEDGCNPSPSWVECVPYNWSEHV